MVVVQVVNVRWFNATVWYGLYLARLMQDAGHTVIVITQAGTDSHKKALEWGLDARPLDLNTANPLRLAVTLGRLVALLRQLRPQIVNCHRGEGFFLWGLLKPFFGYRLVRTRGDQRPPRADALNRFLHAKVCDAVVVTNSHMAKHFLSVMKTPEDKVWLIHGGVDRERFRFDAAGRERVRAEFRYGERETVIALVGRFDRVKGQRETLEAVARLVYKQSYRRVRLMLLGFGSATGEDEVRGWIKELKLERFVAITGRRDDIAACLSAADIGIVASLWSETIARAALEIMACGRPLLSSNVGVMPDLLPPEALFPPGDVDAMTKLLTRAIDDAAYRKENLKACDLTLSQLSGRDFLQRTLTLYEGFFD
ncbi:MAG TPA: glycosyltransferase family 4 protein [Humidesulfovibrio sp.]|uniref:glycosyltransferase family 4 protein n=1 Tax=Humidesulfovibrio sp. TaxID=2910988 RepID=UPI002C1E3353|nr:glycosyltransferase family 4 protein [Humidesulfovibrio sp.]HWR03702.1 glycosyltransferase family 4 protein [Humidesulfovibrio sp.]